MTNTQLQRRLSLLDSVFLGLGAILGAGVFVVTGVAAQVAGPAMLVGFFIAGLVALCNALSVVQLAKIYPVSGGTYAYAGEEIHSLAGFAAGWMFLTSKLAAAAVVAISFANYVQAIFPIVSVRFTALGLIVVLTGLNFLGIKKASLFNTLIVLFTISVLMFFGLMGLPRVSLANFIPFAPRGFGGILQAASLLFFAYTGYARIATLGEEVENPRINIPRAILIALGGSSILYLLVSFALLGTTPANQVAAGSPIGAAARQWGIPWLELLIPTGAVTAMVSVHLGQLLGISRMFFAMARNGDLPRMLSRISAERDIPHISLLLTGGIVLVLVALTEFFSIVSIASFAILVYYGLANASALRLAPEQRLYPRYISWIGLVSCSVLAISLARNTILTGMLVLFLGVGYYSMSHSRSSLQKELR